MIEQMVSWKYKTYIRLWYWIYLLFTLKYLWFREKILKGPRVGLTPVRPDVGRQFGSRSEFHRHWVWKLYIYLIMVMKDYTEVWWSDFNKVSDVGKWLWSIDKFHWPWNRYPLWRQVSRLLVAGLRLHCSVQGTVFVVNKWGLNESWLSMDRFEECRYILKYEYLIWRPDESF